MKKKLQEEENQLPWAEGGYKPHFNEKRAERFAAAVKGAYPSLANTKEELQQWVIQLFNDKNVNNDTVRQLLDNLETVLQDETINQIETANQIRGICFKFQCNHRRTIKSAGMSFASMLAIAAISYTVIAAACPPLAAVIAVAAITALVTLVCIRQRAKHNDAKQEQQIRQQGEVLAEAVENRSNIRASIPKAPIGRHTQLRCLFCAFDDLKENAKETIARLDHHRSYQKSAQV